MHRRGITLIEVLIVVAVILIVAAISFPVFSRAKESAKATACLGNLSQIGKALALYAIDHDNRFPPYNTIDSAELTRGVPPEEKLEREPGALFKKALLPYGLADEQFYCPSDPLARSVNLPPGFLSSFKYSMTYEHAIAVFKFKAAKYSFQDFQTEDPSAFPYLNESPVSFKDVSWPGSNVGHVAVYPHGPYMITLFLDGHVKRVPFDPSPPN